MGTSLISTEALKQVKTYTAYTFSALRANVSAINGTATVALRDDGVTSANQSLSVTTTGWQEDVTGTETPAADSLCNYTVIGGGSHANTITVKYLLITYEHASTNAPIVGLNLAGAFSNISQFAPLCPGFLTGTEPDTRTELFRPLAVSSLRIYLSDSGASGQTVAIGKNGVSSTNVSITPTSSGAWEDITGSESFASGDDGNFRYIITANGLTTQNCQVQLDTETGIVGEGLTGSASSATTREYEGFGGDLENSSSADDNHTLRIGAVTVANLQCKCSTAGSGTRDVTVRVASANSTNLTISITGTGYFEDVSGSDSVGDTDHLGWSLASTGTAVEIRKVALEVPWVATAAAFEPRGRPYGNVGAQQMAQLIVQ